MDNNITYILENVVSKARYNKETGKRQIKEEDYINLKLSNKQKKLLRKICKNLGIELEYKGYNYSPLPAVCNELLFQEYNEIKLKLENANNSKEKAQLEQRRIEIRNKIAKDNLELINSIINRRITGIHNRLDKDDIYQTGYEMLLNYLDRNYLDKHTFKNNISSMLMLYIERKMMLNNENISCYTKKQVSNLINTKNETPTITDKELLEKLGIKQDRLEELHNIKNFLLSLSIEEEIESINNQETNDNSLLFDDTFEERLIDKYSRQEIISIIISTLPKEKQNILNLYYGLNGNIPHTMPEIAKIYGLTKVRISSIIKESLQMIKNSLRVKYLEEIYELPYSFEEEQDDNLNLDLEEFLIRQLPSNILEEIKKELNQNQANFLTLYCHKNNYRMIEIAQILNISKPHLYQIKKETIEVIRSKIISSRNNNKYITYNEYYKYIEYLMHLYLHKSKRKKRG